jgi:hypothetical protein
MLRLTSSFLPAVLLCAATRATALQTPDTIARLIPRGKVDVELLAFAASPRFLELTQRLQLAVQKDMAWWMAHLRAATPGQPVPYHEKMGLTRAEYDEMGVLAKRMTFRVAATGRLSVRSEGDSLLIIDGGSDVPDLTGVVIDMARDEVRTPFGVARDRREIHRENDDSTAAWDGVQWIFEEGQFEPVEAMSGVSVSLALGRFRIDGRGLLHYRGVRARGGTRVSGAEVILRFDPPAVR